MTDSKFHLDKIYKRKVHIWKVSFTLKTMGIYRSVCELHFDVLYKACKQLSDWFNLQWSL